MDEAAEQVPSANISWAHTLALGGPARSQDHPGSLRAEDLVEGSDELGVASWLRARSRRSGGAASVSSKSVWTMKESPAMTPWGCAGGTRLGRSVPPGPRDVRRVAWKSRKRASARPFGPVGYHESVRRLGHSALLATEPAG